MVLKPNALCRADAVELMECVQPESAALVYLDPPWPNEPNLTLQGWDRSTSLEDQVKSLANIILHGRRILYEKGIICCHLNLALSPYLRFLLDEIFGRERFITEIVIPGSRRNRPARHSQLILYAKSPYPTYKPPTRKLTASR